jgi:ABC-type sugar transport system substrate-binding protein
MKNTRLLLLSALLIVGALASAHSRAQEASKAELKVGFVPGPYIDEFKAGVAPELQNRAIASATSNSPQDSKPTTPCSRARSTPM